MALSVSLNTAGQLTLHIFLETQQIYPWGCQIIIRDHLLYINLVKDLPK